MTGPAGPEPPDDTDDALLDDLADLLDDLRTAAAAPPDLDVEAIWARVRDHLDD